MFLTLLQNRKSSLPSLKKKKVSLSNRPTIHQTNRPIFKDDAKRNTFNSNISYLTPPLYSDYDFITELLQSKTAKYDKSDEKNNFSFIKDSLTLISTKLNVIKEEDIISPIDVKKSNNQHSSKSMSSINKLQLDEDLLDEENLGFSTCPSSPCKVVSITNMDTVSESSDLLLSCNISNDTLAEKNSIMENSLNTNYGEMFDDRKDFLEKLLNMTDTVTLEKKYSDCHLEDTIKNFAGTQCNSFDISAVSRSQQTIYTEKSKLVTQKKAGHISINKNINKMKKLSQANQTSDRVQKQCKSFTKPASNSNMYVKKQNVTNRGDFSNVNKNKPDTRANAEYISRKYKNVANRCFVYIPRMNLKNKHLNGKKWLDVKASTFTKKQEKALANLVIELPKEKQNNSYIDSVQSIDKDAINVPKNYSVTRSIYKNQSKRGLGIRKDIKQDMLINENKYEKTHMPNSEFGSKSCITDATTESVMKILLKRTESKNDLHLGSNSCANQSMVDVNEPDKSDSKVFATDSSLFFNNAYKYFKEHKHSASGKQCNNGDNCTIARDQFLNISSSNDQIQSNSCLSSSKNTECVAKTKEKVFIDKTKTACSFTAHCKKNEKNYLSSDFRQSEIVTIYTTMSEEKTKSVASSLVHCKSVTKTVSVTRTTSRVYSILNKTVNSVPRIAQQRRIDTKVTKDANVNTLIAMKKNTEILKLNRSLEVINKKSNKNEITFGNVTENLENMHMTSRGSHNEMNTLSPGSSFTLFSTSKRDSQSLNKDSIENKFSRAELTDTRQYSSEQFIREISNTSHPHHQPISVSSQQFENDKPIATSVNEECCSSLYKNKTNYGASTTVSPVPLSEVDSISSFSSKPFTPFESPKFIKKNTIYNTTENIIQRIKKLPFSCYECEWQRCTDDMWQFKLLNGRLFLILRLENRKDPYVKVGSERRIVSIGLHKYVLHRKRNNLSAYCVKFVGDSIRFYIATKKWDRIGQVPCLLAKCCSIVRLGEKWENDMREAKLRFGYELDNNGLLSMQVENSTLNTMWYITMRVELQKDSYRPWSWPEAKDIRFKQAAGGRSFGRSGLIAKLGQINLDWDHVANTLWIINDYIRHNKQGALSKITSYRCLHRNPIGKVQSRSDQHSTVAHNLVQNIYRLRSRSPCPFTPLFIN